MGTWREIAARVCSSRVEKQQDAPSLQGTQSLLKPEREKQVALKYLHMMQKKRCLAARVSCFPCLEQYGTIHDKSLDWHH